MNIKEKKEALLKEFRETEARQNQIIGELRLIEEMEKGEVVSKEEDKKNAK